jgi:hypothetical protein
MRKPKGRLKVKMLMLTKQKINGVGERWRWVRGWRRKLVQFFNQV